MSINLIHFFDKGVAIEPDRPCLVSEASVRTYRETQAMSCRIANALADSGIARGAHIAVLSHNATRAFECVLGVIRAGCVWVPVNFRNSVDESAYVLDHTDATVLFYAQAFAATVAQLLLRCPRIATAICIDAEGLPGHPGFDRWIAGAADAMREFNVDGSATATLACSGGTTGKPKGVVTTHRTWAYRIAETLLRSATERPVHLVAAPMTHAAGGAALEMMAMGATHIVLQTVDPAAIVAAIGKHRVTHFFLPPTAIYRLLAYPGVRQGDYSSLRYFTYAAAPMSLDRLKEAIEVFGPVMAQGYGGTELGTSTCWFPPEEHVKALAANDDERLASCGRPSPLARLEIADDAGNILPAGEQGEIIVRSYSNASAYYKNPEETAQAFGGGWFRTGDIGYKTAAGWVYLRDRKKDVIISGGMNIYPSEIEKALLAHASVQECAVVGAPHEDWGEAVKAVVELKPGTQATAAELEALCRATLAGYKIPKSFEFWAELPRSPVGKVLKREVRARYWQARAKQI